MGGTIAYKYISVNMVVMCMAVTKGIILGIDVRGRLRNRKLHGCLELGTDVVFGVFAKTSTGCLLMTSIELKKSLPAGTAYSLADEFAFLA